MLNVSLLKPFRRDNEKARGSSIKVLNCVFCKSCKNMQHKTFVALMFDYVALPIIKWVMEK